MSTRTLNNVLRYAMQRWQNARSASASARWFTVVETVSRRLRLAGQH